MTNDSTCIFQLQIRTEDGQLVARLTMGEEREKIYLASTMAGVQHLPVVMIAFQESCKLMVSTILEGALGVKPIVVDMNNDGGAPKHRGNSLSSNVAKSGSRCAAGCSPRAASKTPSRKRKWAQ